MRERESQLDREVAVDLDADIGADTGTDHHAEVDREAGTEDSGLVRSRVDSLLSARSVLIAFVLSIAGIIIFGAIPFLGIVGELLGVAAAGFCYGLGTDTRRYLEMGIAGAIAGGGSALLGNLFVALVASGTILVAVGLLGGAIAGLIGHYFGRDLRDGLTRDLHGN